MGREEQRKKNKELKKKAKGMLTDAQLERIRTATINEEVAVKLERTWDKLGDYFIQAMKKYRIGEERRIAIWKECSRMVDEEKQGVLRDGK